MAGGEQEEEPDAGAANRGAPAALSPSGEVFGSGAGAGGGGAPEDIDDDPASGGGADIAPSASGQPDTEADASNHGSR